MIHHIYACQSNIGDWLSARAIQSLLSPLTVIEHLCDEPFVKETLWQLARASPKDFVIIGGGGLFMDYFEPFWRELSELPNELPFGIWGIGYCDLKQEMSRPKDSLLEAVVRRSRLCVVRDELTRQRLSGCSLRNPIPCPCTTIVQRPRRRGRGILHVSSYGDVGAEVYETMRETGKVLGKRTGRKYEEVDNQIPDGSEGDLARTLSCYDAADLVITSRLHGCIVGLCKGCKVLAVSGDRKIESFMQAAGLAEWVLDLTEATLIATRLEELPKQASPWTFLETARHNNALVADEVRSLIRSCCFES